MVSVYESVGLNGRGVYECHACERREMRTQCLPENLQEICVVRDIVMDGRALRVLKLTQ